MRLLLISLTIVARAGCTGPAAGFSEQPTAGAAETEAGPAPVEHSIDAVGY